MNLQLGTPQKLGWRPFTSRPTPAVGPLGRVRLARVCKSHASNQEERGAERAGVLQNAIIAALFAVSAAVGLPLSADARAEEPLPKPTEFDELQKIIASRTGGSGSLLESFKKSVAQPTQVAQTEAAKLIQSSPLANPAPALGAVTADTSAAASVPPEAAVGLAAVLGIAGIAYASNGKKGAESGSAKAAVKKAAKAAPAPVKKAARAAPAPIKKAARAAPAPVKRAAKQLPVATKKVQVPGSKRAGTQRPGTLRATPGTKRAGGAVKQASRIQIDEDTQTTVGALGVVGLGVAVSAFLIFSVVTGVEAPQASPSSLVDQVAKKLPAVPDPLPVKEAIKEAVAPAASFVAEKVEQVEAPAASSVAEKAEQVEAPPVAQSVEKAQEAVEEAAPPKIEAVALAEEAVESAAEAPAAVVEKLKEAVPEPPPKVPEPEEIQLPTSEAFEEAVKKLVSSADAAGQFKAITDNTAPEAKAAAKSAFTSSASSKAASGSGGNQNTLLLGGAAVAAIVGVIAAAPKGDADSSSAPTAGGGSGGGDTAAVKDDIAQRKQEVKTWISEWRQRTGGK